MTIFKTRTYKKSNGTRLLICLNHQTQLFKRRMDRLPFPIINSFINMKNHMMDPHIVSDTLIEKFLNVPENVMKTNREQYLLRETIYSLMRLSKSEQMLAIRRNVDYLVPASLVLQPVTGGKRKRRSKSPYPGQSWLAFGK